MFDPHAPVPRQVIVRHALPGPPDRVFALFTSAAGLQSWFCDAAESVEALNGDVHAAWHDEEGATWERIGRWVVFDPPRVAVLEWYGVQTAGKNAGDDGQLAADYWRIAVAPGDDGAGSVVTVVSPLVASEVAVRPELLADAARVGWDATFGALRELLAAPAEGP
ncbi:MAG: SRPBCC domain-containing protein [Deltaproteobacteria bacterium]|nr:SRPBCC domain-containing protein [Deltaproteobacteria bacterium]